MVTGLCCLCYCKDPKVRSDMDNAAFSKSSASGNMALYNSNSFMSTCIDRHPYPFTGTIPVRSYLSTYFQRVCVLFHVYFSCALPPHMDSPTNSIVWCWCSAHAARMARSPSQPRSVWNRPLGSVLIHNGMGDLVSLYRLLVIWVCVWIWCYIPNNHTFLETISYMRAPSSKENLCIDRSKISDL